MKFKKCDRCRITGNSNLHGFEIGEEVEIDGEMNEEGDYVAWRLDHSDWWWVSPEDMELITDLTLMQKFEAGWIFTNKDGTTVTDMGVLKSGKIAVIWSDGVSSIVDNEQEILRYHTITPPAPKVEVVFTPIIHYKNNEQLYCSKGYESISEAKLEPNTTCILEHHKVDGKWVFVKAHNV